MKRLFLLGFIAAAYGVFAYADELDSPAPVEAVSAPVVAATVSENDSKFRSIEDTKIDALVDSIRYEIVAKKYDRAPLLLKAAKFGNANACNLLGWMFDNGVRVKKDPVKALKWFESCANANALAAYNAGVIYFEGRGTVKTPEKGVEYFKLAWSKGGTGFRRLMPQIPIRLSYYYKQPKDRDEAMMWAERAAERNAKHGKYLIAKMLIDDKRSNVVDSRILTYLQESTDSYNPQAAVLLGWVYGTGKVTTKDRVLAHGYELIATKMDSKKIVPILWGNMLDDEKKKKAEGFAQNWIAKHKKPKNMDFSSTFNGLEEQFAK